MRLCASLMLVGVIIAAIGFAVFVHGQQADGVFFALVSLAIAFAAAAALYLLSI